MRWYRVLISHSEVCGHLVCDESFYIEKRKDKNGRELFYISYGDSNLVRIDKVYALRYIKEGLYSKNYDRLI